MNIVYTSCLAMPTGIKTIDTYKNIHKRPKRGPFGIEYFNFDFARFDVIIYGFFNFGFANKIKGQTREV